MTDIENEDKIEETEILESIIKKKIEYNKAVFERLSDI